MTTDQDTYCKCGAGAVINECRVEHWIALHINALVEEQEEEADDYDDDDDDKEDADINLDRMD